MPKSQKALHEDQVDVGFFDIDGTLFRGNFSLVLIRRLYEQGKVDAMHYRDLQEAFMTWQSRRGTYDKVNVELLKATNVVLEGMLLSDIVTMSKQIAAEGLDLPYRFTHVLLDALKVLKPKPLLVGISGSPLCIVEPYCKALGFDEVYATEFDTDAQGRIVGGFERAISSPYHSKGIVCQAIAERLQLTRFGERILRTIAVGDARADERMFGAVEYPIAFNPTAELLQLCREKGIPFIIERKDVILAFMTQWQDAQGAFEEVALGDILPRVLAESISDQLPNMFAH